MTTYKFHTLKDALFAIQKTLATQATESTKLLFIHTILFSTFEIKEDGSAVTIMDEINRLEKRAEKLNNGE